MKKLMFLFVSFLGVFALLACDGETTTASTTEAQDEPVVLNWNIGADPRTLDPGLNGASDGGDVINNTFEGLVREKQGEVLPGMAETWEVSADGLTVTFNIRDDAKWSDGSALTADDFVRSWLRGMDPRSASEYSWLWSYTNVVGAADFANSESSDDAVLDALADAVGVSSENNGAQLVVELTTPTNWFVSLMSFYHFMPVPETADTEGEGQWAKNPTTAISNGPFVLTDYTVGDKLKLEKNPNYWNVEDVGIDVINGYFIDIETTAYARYEAGELDFIPSVPTAMIPGLMIASQEFHVFPLLGTYYINFNLSGDPDIGGTRDIGTRDNEVFFNANLRKALALAIDREAITEALGAGQVPAGGFISPGFKDHNNEDFYENSKNDSDIVVDDGAYALAVTYFETAADELYPTATDPVAELRAELETKEYRYNTSEAHKQVAELVQGMWEDNLGFTIQLGNEEWALFQATRTDGNYDMARGGWLTDFMDPSGMLGIFVQGNAYNDPDYNNAAFEAKIEEAQTATTAAGHFGALYEAHEIFMDDMPVIPIYHYNDTMLVKSYVKGWSRSVLGGIDFSSAYLDN
ncbi:MAG: peptide ABC transporter substrate-binding protein [Candidatus Izimaplasma sp.]|nr:peptide ABC transporter substrate-binding protein [Candidatus Izimaplasma bacterium]